MKAIIQVVLFISSIQHREKIATLLIFFFITRCQYGNCQSMWKEEENIFYQEVDVVKNKNLGDVTVDSCKQKPNILSSIQGLRKLVKADSVCLLQNITTQRLPGFRFLCFRSCCKCQRGVE